ncbi:MAG: porin [Gemmatimonas sp.]|uniref:porin n=1 Tax=Gemmatimonas sp. TaxID=1962908 RepID=UPI0031BD0A6F|nr:porin [Gemmatimonas sp.]
MPVGHGFSRRVLPVIIAVLFSAAAELPAQATPPKADAPKAAAKPWYESFRIRGYGQIRYNRLGETNDQLQCEQCDRSWGQNGGFFIRRARLIVQGQIHPQVYIYLQPDFASTVGTSGNVAQLRDWYVDVGIDQENEFRFRVGQSKVPFSYENMQSSSNRLPLDRADATNSANANERDLGVFFMWAPKVARARLAELTSNTGKGSGDYGVFAIGAFNGQTANRADANDNQHVVARLTYPIKLRSQIVEPAIAAYTGLYTVTADQRSTGVKGRADWTYRDERVLATLNVTPRPFGVLAEYNIGRGPEYTPARDSIETRSLHGGFVTATYKVTRNKQVLFPFLRYQVYEGGKKQERDARSHSVNDIEFGVEWQPNPSFELVTEWYHGDRRFEDRLKPRNRQRGSLFRIQAQFNY